VKRYDPLQIVLGECRRLNIPSPAAALTQLSGGVDPRLKPSELQRIVKRIQSAHRLPTDSEFEKICELLLDGAWSDGVSVEVASRASATLMPYIAPKMESGSGDLGEYGAVTTLTDDEIKRFRMAFDDDF